MCRCGPEGSWRGRVDSGGVGSPPRPPEDRLPRNRLRRTLVGAFLFAACADEGDPYPDVPVRCGIELDPASIVLGTDSTLTDHNAGRHIQRDSRGRFYALAFKGESVLQWSSEGRLERVIGRRGEGPGEFGRGASRLLIGPGDTLYVRDGHQHWVVFGPDFRFVRNSPLGVVEPLPQGAVQFLPDGRLFATNLRDSAFRFTIAITDKDGSPSRLLAPKRPSSPEWGGHRPAAYVGDGRVWVAPQFGPVFGYLLEIWDTSGVLLDSIRRRASWFPERPDLVHQRPEEGGHGPAEDATGFRSIPSVSFVVADGEGIVWVWNWVAKGPRATERLARAPMRELDALFEELTSVRIEAFDAKTKALLGAREFPFESGRVGGPIPGTRLVFQLVENGDGVGRHRIASLRLTDSTGKACRL